MKITASNLIRWTGVSTMAAGIYFAAIQPIHPPDVLASVNTGEWAIITTLKTAMCLLFLVGIAGIYARQVNKAGWLGLAGFLLFSLSWGLMVGFVFAETFILPLLATTAPNFVAGFLGSFSGPVSGINMGILPTLWTLDGSLYIGGGLLFGIATLRAGILPRGAAGLLAFGTALAPVAALLPAKYEPLVAVPVGLALAWLGYALWSERRAQVSEPVPGRTNAQLSQTGAD